MNEWNQKARMTSIRLRAPDIKDEQVWVQSTLSSTHKLPRGHKDDFSFARADLVMITNRGEDFATLELECLSCGESGLFVGSTRRGSWVFREKMRVKYKMQAGEVLTLRSLDAVEPVGAHADGSPIMIRPGQSVAVGPSP